MADPEVPAGDPPLSVETSSNDPPAGPSSSGPGPKSGAAASRRRRRLNGPPGSPAGPASGSSGAATPFNLGVAVALPITVARICVPEASRSVNRRNLRQTTSDVERGTSLFEYYAGVRPSPSERAKGKARAVEEEEPPAAEEDVPLMSYDSPAQGTLTWWGVAEGQVLRAEDGWSSKPVVRIAEPCTHAVQWQGQCAICGKDLTELDYTGISDTSRATLAISHSDSALTVSRLEAERLESESKSRLLVQKKLSLIVDLDQTIVHATVDPTVGEWMDDPHNPNHEALKGVGRFQLADPIPTNKGVPVSANDPDACWYYLKMRPGLAGFLKDMSELYEMHVYTMGTRAYAMAVCKLIDPDGVLFGGRILSRDESGSLTQKSLDRLFPVDTSMVVIIDDRSDVWENSPNLVPVVPYNFFGIGDINGAYLPRREIAPPLPTVALMAPSPDPTTTEADSPASTSVAVTPATAASVPGQDAASTANQEAAPKSDLVAVEGGLRSPVPAPAPSASAAQSRMLTEQLTVRPLKRRQEELEAHRKERKNRGSAPSSVNGSPSGPPTPSSKRSSRSTTPALPPTMLSAKPASAPPTPVASAASAGPTGSAAAEAAESVGYAARPSAPGFSTANILGLQTTGAGPSFLETETETEDGDDTSDDDWGQEAVLVDSDTELQRLGAILSDVHGAFFMQDRPERSNTREVIAAMKEEVLTGVTVAFSSVWPMGAVAEAQDAWKQARSLGARCVENVTAKTTHLVAAKFGTVKVNAALKRGIFVVTQRWLQDAALLWRHPNEQLYLWQSAAPAAGPSISLPTSISDENDRDSIEEMDFDWKGANEEVMAFEDTDDDASEADIAAGPDNGVKPKRKRERTSTATTEGEADVTTGLLEPQRESPLSKRQRLARSRSSKLKLSSADDLDKTTEVATGPPSSILDDVSQASGEDDLDLDALASELWG